MNKPLGISPATKSAFAGLVGALHESMSADATPDQGKAPGVDAVTAGSPAPSDAWVLARAEYEALKAQVEHERRPKPPRQLRDDEAWPEMPPKNGSQENTEVSGRAENGESSR